MRRAHRLAVGGAAMLAAIGAGLLVPRLLPALPGFEVRRVEITGTHLLPPREVLRSAGIRPEQSVWEDASAWEQALEKHAVIETARVTRRLPGTLRVEVREKQPVAYVGDGVLTPVTATGERLPIDPARAAADLPIARGADGEGVPAALLGEAGRLARMDPTLFAEVSEIRARDADATMLLLHHADADIILPAGVPADRLMELRAVLADLEGRHGEGDAGGVVRVDLRFADQVVVRLPSSVQKP